HILWRDWQPVAGSGRGNADAALVAALAAGSTIRDAAKTAGVAERTVYRRLEDPGFRQRVNNARAELIAHAVGKLAEASTAAALGSMPMLTWRWCEVMTMTLGRRVEELEARVPAPSCGTCGQRPVLDVSGDGSACLECGRPPFMFTIDIDRAGGTGDDAA